MGNAVPQNQTSQTGKGTPDLSDTGVSAAIGAATNTPAKPATSKPAALTVVPNADPVEALADKLSGKKFLNRIVETIDSYMPVGFDGLVEAMNANLPDPGFLDSKVVRKFLNEHWLPIIQRKNEGEIVVAIRAHDDRGNIVPAEVISLPILDKLDKWMSQNSLLHRLNLLLVSGENFERLSTLLLDDTKRKSFLGELDSEKSSRENFYAVLQRAVKLGATDIHIEGLNAKDYRIRYRLDGALVHDGRTILAKRGISLIRAIKVMGSAINEDARKPWDGSINPNAALIAELPFMKGRSLRISTMPTLNGEDAAIRILQSADVSNLKLQDLRLSRSVESQWRRLLEAPNGVLLVAGPTGSGKSTTLAASLRELNTIDTKIITLEDPVEQLQPGVIQSPMHSGLGYNFAAALRSTLRHDPDIILVGEVRDAETAQVMTQGANTGHLLLSTIHTNDSISVFKRLRELGIDESQILASLLGVLSQRLVRCLCGGCRERYDASEDFKKMLGSGKTGLDAQEMQQIEDAAKSLTFWRVGPKMSSCRDCSGRGYKGRVAIPELWVIGEGERDLISRGNPGHKDLFNAALEGGMIPMSIAGLDYVLDGVTDLAELRANVIRPDELISKRSMFINYLRDKAKPA